MHSKGTNSQAFGNEVWGNGLAGHFGIDTVKENFFWEKMGVVLFVIKLKANSIRVFIILPKYLKNIRKMSKTSLSFFFQNLKKFICFYIGHQSVHQDSLLCALPQEW